MSREFELHEFEDDDMRPEYDFSKGVRGGAYRPLDQGYTITVHKEDGSTEVTVVAPSKDAVILEPDVKEYFPDSEAVNHALRSIIALFPKQSKRSTVAKGDAAPKRRAASAR
ncbi:MAG: hypothetical protein MUC34_14910 [Anaerolineae bacterium]|jgi:hypothetical protein|nr:hypothetical protein [Anaerolineae bacterium]